MGTVKLEDLPALIGRPLGPTRSVRIDQSRIDRFADTTEDVQWIHVDPGRAAAGPFGTTIGHGYLTLSLAAHFGAELLTVEGVGMAVNYGLDRVRFPSPVPSDSDVSATGEVLSVSEFDGGLQVRVRIVITASGAYKPACVADTVTRFYA